MRLKNGQTLDRMQHNPGSQRKERAMNVRVGCDSGKVKERMRRRDLNSDPKIHKDNHGNARKLVEKQT